jgi:dihydroorotate dehydrogenase (fumarate)
MDLSSVIAGVSFRVGLMNASGALCVTQAELEALGMTPLPREGNPHPRYVAIDGGSINSMGLPNLGYPAYAKLIPELKRFKKPVIASLAGLHPDDFLKGAKALNAAGPDFSERGKSPKCRWSGFSRSQFVLSQHSRETTDWL